MLTLSVVPLRAQATPIRHQPPWQQELCTPVQVSVAHVDVVRVSGCTLPNPLAMAGFVSQVPAGPQCPAGHGGCANVTPHWGAPTDSYQLPSAGTWTVHAENSPGVCFMIGLHRGDTRYGQGCGPDFSFTTTDRPRIVVTMTGSGLVSSITYAPA